jgi:HK97 family phage portal protein
MGIGSGLIRLGLALERAKADNGKKVFGSVYDLSWGTLSSGSPDTNMARYRGWISTCIDVISESAAGVDAEFFDKRTDKALPVTHKLQAFIADPCRDIPTLTRTAVLKLFFSWLEIEGDAFAYIERDAMNVPVRLLPISPTRMYIVPNKETLIGGYIYRYMGEEIAFKTEEILHLRYPNPVDLLRGMGTIEKAIYEADANTYLKLYQQNAFKNQGLFAGILTPEYPVDEDQAEAIRERWAKIYAGKNNARRVVVLTENMKFTPIQNTPAEMDFLASIKATRDDIIGMFRVPGKKLGYGEDVNKANGFEIEQSFQADVIRPRLKMVAEVIERQISQRIDKRIGFRFTNNVPADRTFELQQEKQDLETGVQIIDDIRAKRGLKPAPWGSEPWLNNGLSQPSARPAQFNPPPLSRIQVIRNPWPVLTRGMEESDKDVLWRAFSDKHESIQSAFERDMRGFYGRLFDEVLRRLNSQRAVNIDISYTVEAVTAMAAEAAAIAEPHWIKALEEGIRKGLAEFGKDQTVKMGPRIQNWLVTRADRFKENITQTTLTELNDALTAGLANNESWDEIAARISKIKEFAEDSRASNAAITETTGALNKGTIEVYQTVGDVLKNWLTARDGNEREWHGVMDGQKRELSEAFISGRDVALMFPGDPDANDPAEVCRCRCAMYPSKK